MQILKIHEMQNKIYAVVTKLNYPMNLKSNELACIEKN